MESILDEFVETASTVNNRAKLIYLTEERDHQEQVLKELKQNNLLLRRVNEDLVKHTPEQSIIKTLTLQNNQLQLNYSRLLIQNQKISSTMLLQQQILDENQQQNISIMHNYQQKIIELRRSIQSKEANIQNLEARIKGDEKIVTPATNVTMLFFNQIQELKRVIQTLTTRNKELQENNRKLQENCGKIQKRLHLLQFLTTKSKLMFQEFKSYYNDDKRRSSAPKKDAYIPFDSSFKGSTYTPKKLNEAQTRETRQFSQCLPVLKDSSLKMLLYKGCLQIERLRQALQRTRNNLKYEQKSRMMIVRSYNNEQIKQGQIMKQLNYYKKSTQDLIKIFSYRTQYVNCRSLQKSKQQKIIQSIKVPKDVAYITDRKQYWLGVQKTMKVQKVKVLKIKRKFGKVCRSISCLIDYRKMQIDQVDKYLNKKAATGQKPKRKEEKISDFSLMIQNGFDDDLSIIQAPARKNYSDWKRNARSQKKQGEMMNLTVIEENIL